jgi:diguanylate cyclase (GGDEF)-like protein
MPSGPIHLLLIDEDLAQYAKWSQFIDHLGKQRFQLNWCSDLAEAKRCLHADIYDVVFIDCIKDPEFSLRLLANVLPEESRKAVVALCDKARPDVRDRALAYGAVDYLFAESLDLELIDRVIRYAHSTQVYKGEVSASGVAESRHFRYSNFDALTGLPNRQLFLDRLHQSLQRLQEKTRAQDKRHPVNEDAGSTLALFYIDLVHFKKVNDSFGHEQGDRLLESIAAKLQQCLAPTDTVARIGGDEFAMLVEGQVSSSIALLAAKLAGLFKDPFPMSGHQVVVSASIGVAVAPQAGTEVDVLLKHVQMAKDDARQQPGTRYRFYNEQMNEQAQSQLYQEADLRRGLRRGEFSLFYQPRVSLASGEIVGMEALIRWHHPIRGMVKPSEFIPLAEEVGLIQPLGYWVVHQACEDINQMDSLGLPQLDVAINLSFKQFEDAQFSQTLERILIQSGVAPERIEFELTETTIMGNAQRATSCMADLAKLGSTFSLDDFGTGYSSFAHIQRLPISALKVDRQFVENLTSNEDDLNIVKAIVGLAHSLNMIVVAEGAETYEHMRILRSLECDQVQGYYFSPPVTFEAICHMVEAKERMQVS